MPGSYQPAVVHFTRSRGAGGGKSGAPSRVWKLLHRSRVNQNGGPARMLTADTVTAETLARERALRAAVLIDAIRCLVGAGGGRERRSRQSALRWLLSRDTQAPFSYQNVCEALGLDPSRLRRSVLEPAFGADGVPRIALGG